MKLLNVLRSADKEDALASTLASKQADILDQLSQADYSATDIEDIQFDPFQTVEDSSTISFVGSLGFKVDEGGGFEESHPAGIEVSINKVNGEAEIQVEPKDAHDLAIEHRDDQ